MDIKKFHSYQISYLDKKKKKRIKNSYDFKLSRALHRLPTDNNKKR